MTILETPEESTVPSTRESETAKRRPGLNLETLAVGALFVSFFAFAAAIIAVGIAGRAIDEHQAIATAGASTGPRAATVAVALNEFMIMPEPLTAPVGSTLAVTNEGVIEHNLSVEGLATPNLAAGDRAELDLGNLTPGTYSVICSIPGHREAGMETTLTIQ